MSDIPKHVAIIPDGNRRWAKQRKLQVWAGHKKAGDYNNLNVLLKEARRLGVKYVSLWGFSTENWKRNNKEINAIFDIIIKGIEQYIRDAEKEKICFKHIGRKDRLPEELVKKIGDLEKETEQYNEFYALLCIDYGGRDEIVRAVNKILNSGKEKIEETEFYEFLDTNGLPEPDLIIRTGDEMRLSGFMPFQSVYSELYFTKTYFPDFDKIELRKAIAEYGKRQRRYGS